MQTPNEIGKKRKYDSKKVGDIIVTLEGGIVQDVHRLGAKLEPRSIPYWVIDWDVRDGATQEENAEMDDRYRYLFGQEPGI